MFEAGVDRRDGGSGKERARLKIWITRCSCVRTLWRVFSLARAGGSAGFASLASAWTCPFVWAAGSAFESVGSKPLCTNLRIELLRGPRVESVSARANASPRRSSTSYDNRVLVRRMSSVRSVRVFERRTSCVLRLEMCDWVCVARVERDGVDC